MENYLELLKICRHNISELEASLELVNAKIKQSKKTSQGINAEFSAIVKHLESLSKLVGESEESLNNAALFGVIFIATILISFFLLKILGPKVLIGFFSLTILETISFTIREHFVKKRYRKLRYQNSEAILDEKENIELLEEKRRENSKSMQKYFREKYALEEKIRVEEEIASEILGHFAPLLDDLIMQDASSHTEYLDEAMAIIAKSK